MQFLVNIWNAQRNARYVSSLMEGEAHWRTEAIFHASRADEAEAENAALRSQINQRGAGGKFVPKQPK